MISDGSLSTTTSTESDSDSDDQCRTGKNVIHSCEIFSSGKRRQCCPSRKQTMCTELYSDLKQDSF